MKYGVYLLIVIVAVFTWLDVIKKHALEEFTLPVVLQQETETISKAMPLDIESSAKLQKSSKKIKNKTTTLLEAEEPYEQEIFKLFKRFLDIETDRTFTWKEFTLKISNVLEKAHTHLNLAKKMRELSDSTTVWYIGYQLLSYKNLLPLRTQKLLKQYSRSELLRRMSFRVKPTA